MSGAMTAIQKQQEGAMAVAKLWGDGIAPKKPQAQTAQAQPSTRGGVRGGVKKDPPKSSDLAKYQEKLGFAEASGDWNIFTGEKKGSHNLVGMTIGQVKKLQSDRLKRNKGSAAGLFQFTRDTLIDTAKEAGLKDTDLFDSKNQTKLFHTFTTTNDAKASEILGRAPSDGERYVLHFLGRGGGSKMLRVLKENPRASFATTFPSAFKANRQLVDKVGGSRATVGDVYRELAKRMAD